MVIEDRWWVRVDILVAYIAPSVAAARCLGRRCRHRSLVLVASVAANPRALASAKPVQLPTQADTDGLSRVQTSRCPLSKSIAPRRPRRLDCKHPHAFRIIAFWEGRIGPGTVGPHHHHGRHEFFYVLEGELVLRIGDERHTARAGTLRLCPARNDPWLSQREQ